MAEASADLAKLSEQLQAIIKKSTTIRKRIANMAVARIGARSVQDFMIDGGKEGVNQPVNADKLTIRSQKLSRAVLGGAGSRKQVKIQQRTLQLIWTILVPYAAIHEFGGTINIPITVQMRKFFWAMWYETKDEKWKWMALTKKTAFKITMKERPYLEPAAKLELPTVQQKAAELLFTFVDEILNS